jgi:hypothetical protein
MAINNLYVYLIKLKQLQYFQYVLEQLSFNIYYKSNNWSVKKDKMIDFLLDKEMKEIFFEKEWNYKLPENHKYNFMKLNNADYYKDIYTYYENIIFRFKICNKYDFPENVKIDYFTFSLNELYSHPLKSYMKFYIVDNMEHWINSYHLVNNLDMCINYRKYIEKIHNSEQMYQYFRNIEINYNQTVKNKLWKWKKMDDIKQKFKWMMKLIRTKHKIVAYDWIHIYKYLF